MIQPSNPGSSFSAADLVRASINPEALGRILTGTSTEADTLQLLALLAKQQVKRNSRFRPNPFSFETYRKQLALSENPMRDYLLIQNVGSGDLMVLFEEGPVNVQDFSADADSQQELINSQTRALRIVAGGYYEPLVAPTNPITLFVLNTATNGVVVEGS